MKPLFDEQTKASYLAGLYRPIDFVFMFVFCVYWFAVGCWIWIGHPPTIFVILAALALMQLTLCWAIIILFRVGFIVLQCRADINLMPEAAAKVALTYQRGGK